MKLHLITITLFTLALVSCGTATKKEMDQTNNEIGLSGTYWVLESFEGKKIDALGNTDREIGFKVDGENNRISGYSGCNTFMGDVSLKDGDQISFSSLGSTKMACPDLAFNEQDFLEIFALADNYRITGDKLELNVAKRAPLAVFKKSEKTVDKTVEPIVEKYWKLKTLDGQEVKMSANQEREVYFSLKAEDNRVTGFAGCNTMSGTYTLEKGNRIQFSQMAVTMMACPDVDFKEHEYLEVFELADNYTINGDELSLNVGRRAPLAVFEAVYFD